MAGAPLRASWCRLWGAVGAPLRHGACHSACSGRALQRRLSGRAVLAPSLPGEWEDSIRQSHPGTSATEAALEAHRSEVGAIRQALGRQEAAISALHQLCEAGADGADPGRQVRWF